MCCTNCKTEGIANYTHSSNWTRCPTRLRKLAETWRSPGTTKVHTAKQTSEKKSNLEDYNPTISTTKLILSSRNSYSIN